MRLDLLKAIRKIFDVRLIRIFTLLLSSLHVAILGHAVTHDYIFTGLCAICYLYACILERLALTPLLNAFRWLLIGIACTIVGRQLTIENGVQRSVADVFHASIPVWLASISISALLLLLEVLAAVVEQQSARSTLISTIKSVVRREKLVGVEVPHGGDVRISVITFSCCGVTSVLYDTQLKRIARLPRRGGHATGERLLSPGRYFIGLTGRQARTWAHVHVSIKNS